MPDTMQAAVYYGPDDLRVEERPIPQIKPREALIKVIATGICGTDLRIYHGNHHLYPTGTVRIPGHEVAGVIQKVGSEVAGLNLEQKVFLAPNMGCGHCRQCISGSNNLCANYQAPGITYDGSFAEYLRVPEAGILQGNLIPLDKDTDPAAAALIEPFACVLRGQDALNIRPGETVLVIGAGPIGIMHVLLARLRGAGKVLVSELITERAEQVNDFGVDYVINSTESDIEAEVMEVTKGEGADVIVVAAPAHKAQAQALGLASLRGRINFFGGLPKKQPMIEFNSNLVHYKELIVTGTTACSTDDCRRAARIVNTGQIDLSRLVGARYSLQDAGLAFLAAEAGKSMKVILDM
jgi:L-iditol 2-dehydrogenase